MVDAVLALTVLELAALLFLRRTALVPTLLAGLALLIAMRLALGGAAPALVALALLLAGLAHLTDLRRRW